MKPWYVLGVVKHSQARLEGIEQMSVSLDNQLTDTEYDRSINWLKCSPFFGMHAACLLVFWVGWSPVAVVCAAAMYVFHMFMITAFLHRYFSHRSFKTSRVVQFLAAVAATSCGQRGPLWWAGHHRHHHKHSDHDPDLHSPGLRGLLMSHVGWFLQNGAVATPERYVRDWAKFPELKFINRFHWLCPIALAVIVFLTGVALERWAPGLGTNGWQMLIWSFVISTVVVYHATYTINSLSHRYGSQPYKTTDDSRNNIWLALLTLGEGWHNNHHYFPASARQGFRWWQIDLTYYVLKVLSWTGLIWDLRGVPKRVLAQAGKSSDAAGSVTPPARDDA